MKIDAVRAFKVTGPADVPAIEERSSQQIDVYPEYTGHERESHKPGAPLTATYVEIDTDDGLTGLFGPIFEETAFIILKKLRPYLLGQDPLAGERLWDILYRQDRHARKGYEMMAISAVDCALWDLRGKALRPAGLPPARRPDPRPGRLLRLDARALARSGARHASARAGRGSAGLQGAEVVLPLRPGRRPGGDGQATSTLVRTVREAVGPNIEIMLDAWMGWDATYAIRLLERIAEYRPRWIEEPVPPDRISDFAQIRRTTRVPIATGEHEYTRWGFLQLLQADAVDVIQADPDWCGGISELVKICTLASAYGRHVIPHGHSIHAAIHTIAAQPPAVCPMAEYIWNPADEAVVPQGLRRARERASCSRRARPRHGARRGEDRAARGAVMRSTRRPETRANLCFPCLRSWLSP